MDSLAGPSEAAVEAAKFAVSPDIHEADFIFHYNLRMQSGPDRDAVRAHITEYYFFDGDRSAQHLDALIRQFHPEAASRRLALLEFASGYGCVSRHLRQMHDRYDLVACDIHPQAVDFLQERLDVAAVLSSSRPQDLAIDREFDVVFALSFFSHMPDRTFGDWFKALFARVAEGGLLIFTTHGRVVHADTKHPTLHPDGYWFVPMSEQLDLSTHDYGCMIATPQYVLDRIARCSGAAPVFLQEAFWWGKQDLYIVRKVAADFRPAFDAELAAISAAEAARKDPELTWLHDEIVRLEKQVMLMSNEMQVMLVSHGMQVTLMSNRVQELRDAIETIRASTSWRVTAPLRALGSLLKRRRARRTTQRTDISGTLTAY